MDNKDKNWQGLIRILWIEQKSIDGNVIWKSENLHNMLHTEGESFILNVLFDGGTIPDTYFFGMDIRPVLNFNDTMATISQSNFEPSTNGYHRVEISSSGEFVVKETDGVYSATSPIISFEASGGSWTAENLFLTNNGGYDGKLISSVPLGTSITVASGQIVSVKMALSLRDVNN